jgi:hypothetical protein
LIRDAGGPAPRHPEVARIGEDGGMSSPNQRPSNPTAWAAFWLALAGLVLMPIPLFIGLVLGGVLSVIAAVLAVIALLKGLARSGTGIAPVVFAAIFIALTWGGISIGGGTVW